MYTLYTWSSECYLYLSLHMCRFLWVVRSSIVISAQIYLKEGVHLWPVMVHRQNSACVCLCACDILTTVDCDWFPQWCLSMNQNHPMWSYSLFLSSSSSSSLLVIPALKMFFPFSGLSWFGWKHLLCSVPLNKNILLMWNSWCLCHFFFNSNQQRFFWCWT